MKKYRSTPPSSRNSTDEILRPRGHVSLFVVFLGIVCIVAIVLISSGSRTIHIQNTAHRITAGSAAIKNVVGILFENRDESLLDRNEISFLLLGKTGSGHIAPDLTDTIMVVSYRKDPPRLLVLSVPRDLLVKTPDGRNFTKINALYAFARTETEEQRIARIRDKVSEITGLAIDYHILIDIAALEKIIDTLGGLNVYIIDDIEDMRFPTPEGGYETFSLQRGWRYLDGETTTRYVRTRHTPQGDFDRIKRQQQVIEALRKKIGGLNPLTDFPKLVSIYETLRDHVGTNITISEAKTLWAIAKDIPQEDISFRSLEKDRKEQLVVSKRVTLGGEIAYTLVPAAGLEHYTEIHKAIRAWLEEHK